MATRQSGDRFGEQRRPGGSQRAALRPLTPVVATDWEWGIIQRVRAGVRCDGPAATPPLVNRGRLVGWHPCVSVGPRRVRLVVGL